MIARRGSPAGTPGERAVLPRVRVRGLVLVGATALALYLCYLLARPFLPALTWALALAVVAYPLHVWICRRLPRPNVAAGLAVLVVTILIIGPAILVTQMLVEQAGAALEVAEDEAATGRWRALLERNPRLAPLLQWVERNIAPGDVSERLGKALESRAPALVAGSLWVGLQLLVTLFVLFYFFRDRRAAMASMRSFLPLSDRETDGVLARVADMIHATIYGTLVVAAVQGGLGGLMFWALGLPAPMLWGVVMGFLAVVPVLGAFIVWIPAAIFLALEGSWGKALILTVWGGVVIAVIDNLLYPVLVGTRVRVHTVPVFFAIVGGLAGFGAAGVILGPVVLAVTMALIEVWRRRTARGDAAVPAPEGIPASPGESRAAGASASR